ncbi:hypothetical protein [Bacillus sp. RC206]|uniref:hypothetical protein n=1 Tax=Bacillus sp. RC206 TaxID=3156281 RepID=UPI00384AE154
MGFSLSDTIPDYSTISWNRLFRKRNQKVPKSKFKYEKEINVLQGKYCIRYAVQL